MRSPKRFFGKHPRDPQQGGDRGQASPRRVGIVGTFDVENYGDLPFPLIAQAALAPAADLRLLPDTAFSIARLWPLDRESPDFVAWRESVNVRCPYVVLQADRRIGPSRPSMPWSRDVSRRSATECRSCGCRVSMSRTASSRCWMASRAWPASIAPMPWRPSCGVAAARRPAQSPSLLLRWMAGVFPAVEAAARDRANFPSV